jgi:hypothetical protein
MSALTHPAVRVVQGNLRRAGFMEFVPLVFGVYIRISKLCTLLRNRIHQLFRILIFKQCQWKVELTRALSGSTFVCIVDMLFGNATSNETLRGLFSVVICRSINLGCWGMMCIPFYKMLSSSVDCKNITVIAYK